MTDKRVLGIYALLYGVGLLGHILPSVRPLMFILTPYVLFLLGSSVFLPFLKEGGRPLLLWALMVFAASFFLEAVGVATGRIFGSYEYGTVLGAHVFGVPPVIGFNWVLVIAGFSLLSERVLGSRAVPDTAPNGRKEASFAGITGKSILAALFTTAFDFLLEPVAIGLGYWTWADQAVPLQNYLSWFLIAFGASFVYFALKINVRNRILIGYVVIQAVYFAVLGFPGLLA